MHTVHKNNNTNWLINAKRVIHCCDGTIRPEMIRLKAWSLQSSYFLLKEDNIHSMAFTCKESWAWICLYTSNINVKFITPETNYLYWSHFFLFFNKKNKLQKQNCFQVKKKYSWGRSSHFKMTWQEMWLFHGVNMTYRSHQQLLWNCWRLLPPNANDRR